MLEQATMQLSGTVSSYSAVNEFGFIEVHGDPREFRVTKKYIRCNGHYPVLLEGQKVQFIGYLHKDGWRAKEVHVISPGGAKSAHTPFHHDEPEKDPKRFRGRREILLQALKRLGSGSILLHGPSGIGKTSVASQIMRIAGEMDGDQTVLAATLNIQDDVGRFRSEKRYITLETGFGLEVPDLRALVERLSRDLRRQSEHSDAINAFAEEEGIPGLAKAILERLAEETVPGSPKPRLLIWIDNIGDGYRNPMPLLKELAGRGLGGGKVGFVLSGNQIPTENRASPIPVGAMALDEVSSLLEAALDPLNVTIAPEARQRLYELSGGLPSLLHELGTEAFYADLDGCIDRRDVAMGFAAYLTNADLSHDYFRRLRKCDSTTQRAVLWAIVTAKGLRGELPFLTEQVKKCTWAKWKDVEAVVKQLIDWGILRDVSDGGKPAYAVKDLFFEEYLHEIFAYSCIAKGPNHSG